MSISGEEIEIGRFGLIVSLSIVFGSAHGTDIAKERERENWYLRASDARSASSKRPVWNKRSQKGDRVSE